MSLPLLFTFHIFSWNVFTNFLQFKDVPVLKSDLGWLSEAESSPLAWRFMKMNSLNTSHQITFVLENKPFSIFPNFPKTLLSSEQHIFQGQTNYVQHLLLGINTKVTLSHETIVEFECSNNESKRDRKHNQIIISKLNYVLTNLKNILRTKTNFLCHWSWSFRFHSMIDDQHRKLPFLFGCLVCLFCHSIRFEFDGTIQRNQPLFQTYHLTDRQTVFETSRVQVSNIKLSVNFT